MPAFSIVRIPLRTTNATRGHVKAQCQEENKGDRTFTADFEFAPSEAEAEIHFTVKRKN